MSIIGLLIAGCGSSAASPAATPTSQATSPKGLQAVIASNELDVGKNRFTFGLLDNNHPIVAPSAQLSFYQVLGNGARLSQKLTATFNYFARGLKSSPDNSAAVDIQGLFIAYPTFPAPGQWGAEVRVRVKGKTHLLRPGFSVVAHSTVPRVGQRAPRSNNPTIFQQPATKLDSGRPPDDMHRLSIAAAIAQHKPLVVLFSTPAYCESRMCGPETQIVQRVEQSYGRPAGRVNFIHIEIWKDANPGHGQAPAVKQWRLQSEPWVFVINRQGIITARFEGPTSQTEILDAIRSTLA